MKHYFQRKRETKQQRKKREEGELPRAKLNLEGGVCQGEEGARVVGLAVRFPSAHDATTPGGGGRGLGKGDKLCHKRKIDGALLPSSRIREGKNGGGARKRNAETSNGLGPSGQ